MKRILFLILAVLTVSCLKLKDNSYFISTIENIGVKQYLLPDTTILQEVAHITAISEQYSDCWSNLYFELTRESDFEYSLNAYGHFITTGTCLEKKINGDTTISFTPTKAGLYKFNIVKGYNNVVIDTMIVKALP
jgi:hypothetical protein